MDSEEDEMNSEEEELRELQVLKMDFTSFKEILCHMLNNAGFEYSVGEDTKERGKNYCNTHLGCYFFVKSHPINRERHHLIAQPSDITIHLIQPTISWANDKKFDEPGEIKTPYETAYYNKHNAFEVFTRVVGTIARMQSDEYRDQLHEKGLVKLSLLRMIDNYKHRIALLKSDILQSIETKLNEYPGRISLDEAKDICRYELKNLANILL